MAMSVQQGVVSATPMLLEARRINRHKRRPFILLIAGDIADGAQALSELDFGRLCRMRGLPEPTRQHVRRGEHGRVFLDVLFEEYDVAVEVEGAHHDAPENAVDDALRQNALVIARLGVLRVPVLGLRAMPDRFMDQVEALLRRAGWRSVA
jgi:very-short-patch-repair endonuclease